MKKNAINLSISLLLFLLVASIQISQSSFRFQSEMKAEEFQFEVGSAFGDRDDFEFNVEQEGTIVIEASWTGDAPSLALILNGPTRQEFARVDGTSPLKVSHPVTQEIQNKGRNWKVSIANFSRRGSARGTVKVTYPDEKKSAPLGKLRLKEPPVEPSAKMIIVPNVVGMSLEEAKKAFEEKGMKTSVKTITQFDPQYKGREGKVVGQSQELGQKLPPGSSIEIIYYNPKMTKSPKQIPSPKDMLKIKLPNLVIRDLLKSQEDVTEGGTVTFTYKIKNTGEDTASHFHVGVYKDEREYVKDYFASLSPEEEETRIHSWINLAQGTHTFQVTADPDNAVSEKSKDDNSKTVSFEVLKVKLIESFTANPPSILIDENVLLNWILSGATDFSLHKNISPHSEDSRVETIIPSKHVSDSPHYHESSIDHVSYSALPHGVGKIIYELVASKPAPSLGQIVDRKQVEITVNNLWIGTWKGTERPFSTTGDVRIDDWSPQPGHTFIFNPDGTGQWISPKSDGGFHESDLSWIQINSNTIMFEEGPGKKSAYDGIISASTLSFKIDYETYHIRGGYAGITTKMYELSRAENQ